MRCFFMKNGHISGVEYLTAKGDDALIEEAHEAFKVKGALQGADGFEIWDRARFVYRFEAAGASKTRESPGPRTWLDNLFDLSKLKQKAMVIRKRFLRFTSSFPAIAVH